MRSFKKYSLILSLIIIMISSTSSLRSQDATIPDHESLLGIDNIACTETDTYFILSLEADAAPNHYLFEVIVDTVGDASIQHILPLAEPENLSDRLNGTLAIGLAEEVIDVPMVGTAIEVSTILTEWFQEQAAENQDLSPFVVTWNETAIQPDIRFLIHATHSSRDSGVTVSTRWARSPEETISTSLPIPVCVFGSGSPVESGTNESSATNPSDENELGMSLQNPVIFNDLWTPVEREFNGVEMVLVPAGSFEMGSTEAEIDMGFEMCQQAADNDAECQRSWYEDEAQNGDNTQTFAEPFWLDRTEVTRAQYQRCVDAGACVETPDSDFSSEPNQPINRVRWLEANDYCKWQYGDDMGRLPTEAEWEYAARGVDRLIFPWGNEFDGTFANHCDSNCGEASWASSYNHANEENDDRYAITAPVGSYPQGASWVGALDMSGNVSEWAFSEYRDYPYDADDGRNDDYLDSNGHYRVDDRRVLRGGSFRVRMSSLRAAGRGSGNPWYEDHVRGFRCFRSY